MSEKYPHIYPHKKINTPAILKPDLVVRSIGVGVMRAA
ncbi:hypothetical protein AN403_2958 [Pseudomonas fluorescens]|uniref:Uncharacterized protein n=1 Tax=Pseudomonas fluorescens TaxID=294 RepID=A0A0P9B9W9_PSEFL|nr:hypothetical protein AN403_2958 [Pseudomonas fluorescens]